MTVAAVSVATAMADSAAIGTAAATAATVVRAVRAKTPKQWLRSKNHGRSWCTPSVFSPPQDLPVHGSERAEDRLQGFQAVDALRLGARQDRAEPHHSGVREEAARARARHQALALSRSASLRDPLTGGSFRTRVIPDRAQRGLIRKSRATGTGYGIP